MRHLITALTFIGLAAAHAQVSAIEPDAATQARLQTTYSAMAEELGAKCPISEPGDVAAFDRCRKALYGDSALRRQF